MSTLVPIVLMGSCGFSVFGGMGMSYYPITLIKSYYNKPTAPKAEEQVLAKWILLQSNKKIIDKLTE